MKGAPGKKWKPNHWRPAPPPPDDVLRPGRGMTEAVAVEVVDLADQAFHAADLDDASEVRRLACEIADLAWRSAGIDPLASGPSAATVPMPPWEGPDELPELRGRLAALDTPARIIPPAPPRRRVSRETSPPCPECRSATVLRHTAKYRNGDNSPRKFWGCVRYPRCRGAIWAEPDGRPVDPATAALRAECLAAVDRLWKSETSSRDRSIARDRVFRGLAAFLGVPPRQLDIDHLSAAQCRRVISSYRGGC